MCEVKAFPFTQVAQLHICCYLLSISLHYSLPSPVLFSFQLLFFLFSCNFVHFSFRFSTTRLTLDLAILVLLSLSHFSLYFFLSSLTSRTLIHPFMPPTYLNRNTNIKDMSQFGLGASNTHWGYGSAASAYSPYLASSGLSSCTTPTSAQFNNPALGFTCSSNDQSNNQDFGGATNRDCVPSKC